jgi:hypothetical protein
MMNFDLLLIFLISISLDLPKQDSERRGSEKEKFESLSHTKLYTEITLWIITVEKAHNTELLFLEELDPLTVFIYELIVQ